MSSSDATGKFKVMDHYNDRYFPRNLSLNMVFNFEILKYLDSKFKNIKIFFRRIINFSLIRRDSIFLLKFQFI